MKIDSIKIDNFLALRSIDLKLSSPALLVAGQNETGKSSFAEAVRMAITGEAERVRLKKDFGVLMRDGATGGKIEITAGEHSWLVQLPKGERHASGVNIAVDFVRACLVPSYFTSLDITERRSFLFRLMGTGINSDQLKERLRQRGCTDETIAGALPLVGTVGFAAAHKEAAARATEAKGEWRGITGENYGEKKAETWQAPVATGVTPEEIGEAEGRVGRADLEIADLNGRIGAAKAMQQATKTRHLELSRLRSIASGESTARSALKSARKLVEDHKPKLEAARAASKGVPVGTECECPDCGVSLVFHEGKLTRWEEQDAQAVDPAKLKELEARGAFLDREVERLEDNLSKATEAAAQVAALQKSGGDSVASADDLDGLQEQLTAAQEKRLSLQREVQRLQSLAVARQTATESTKRARAVHQRVLEWTRLADALSPDGIPADLLTETLKPINNRLRETAAIAGWPQPMIRDDIEILVNGRPYGLQSESAKWRTDFLVAEAIARYSGLRFVMADRMDVNDLPNRARLITLVSTLLNRGVLHGAILLGTFKQPPANLPPVFSAIWLDGGECSESSENQKAVAA